MARIVVVGAGVAGLGVALSAGRSGHRVVLVERDDTPLPEDPHGAFDWDRRGAPQVRHSHAFLARLHNLLRDRHPDVLDALLSAGATPLDFISMLPDTMDRSPMEGDDELVALACRRTTFEWVLRRSALQRSEVALHHGVRVTELVVDGGADIPRVTGVRLDDGVVVEGDLVVLCGGRRSDVPALLAPHGIAVPEVVEDTGIVYYSRFFALRDGEELPPQVGPIGGDLQYLKYGVFPGDNRTFSITLAARTDDTELRRHLRDPIGFGAVAASVPGLAAHVAPTRSEPITDVHVMAGLLNRQRRFLLDDSPVVLGLHVVGDAHTCTNPLYGRGCSLAMVQAQLLTDALDEHGTDHLARAVAFERATEREVVPWYRAAVAQDRAARSAATTGAADGSSGPSGDAATPDIAEIVRDGLVPALRTDPVVLRAFLRMFNLLAAPDSILSDGDVLTRVMAVYADRANRPAEAPQGPRRDELLAGLTA